jgi:flagellar basal-body rod protein FlgF
MNYGLQISASGAQTGMYRLEVAANNLANINTPGFKPDMAAVAHRDAARIEDGVLSLPSNRMLEMLGAGVQAAPNNVKFGQGSLRTTGNPLDLALRGDGFFQVATSRETGDGNESQLRLTRNGSFTRAADGRLVTTGDGLSVLDSSGSPIVIPDSDRVNITTDGVVSTRRGIIARIGVVDVPDRTTLTKEGHGLFRMNETMPGGRPFSTDTTISQGHLEEALVNEVNAILAVRSASKTVESNMGMIASHDRMMEMAISRLGRTA